jgi:hypothetical protein
MRRYLFGALALAAVAMAATAVPALSADSGTVAVSVTAQAPAAPCLTVSPGTVDFGTLPFSGSNTDITRGEADITFNFCGTANSQILLGSTTPATGPSGSWTPQNDGGGVQPSVQPCPGPNQFYLAIFDSGTTGPALYMTGTPAPVLGAGGNPLQLTGSIVTKLAIRMPCKGSNGAGETKSLTATFTAVVP